MTLFWIAAAGLIALALLFILPPLFSRRGGHRDPDRDQLALTLFQQQLRELDADLATGALDRRQHRAARRDLERELLQDVEGTAAEDPPDAAGGRWVAVLLAVLLPAVAVPLYLYLGHSELIPRLAAAATAGVGTPAARPGPSSDPPPLEIMIQRLADKLEQNPDNLEGWMMLGRTYFAIGQPQKALRALEQAYGLAPDNPDNPDVLVAYAEAIAATKDSELAGRPAELIQAALELAPEHTGARWLQGLVSFQAARYGRAAEQWAALLATFDPNSEEAAELTRYIAEAHSRAGSEPKPTPAQAPDGTGTADAERKPAGTGIEEPTTPQPAAAAATGAIRVEVSLAEPLWPQANVKDTVFIYAKVVSGPPMPLAARRARVADLPATLILDDGIAIDPAMKLSGFPAVTLVARISKSGQAMPRSGDLEGTVSPVQPGRAGTVKLIIDRVRP